MNKRLCLGALAVAICLLLCSCEPAAAPTAATTTTTTAAATTTTTAVDTAEPDPEETADPAANEPSYQEKSDWVFGLYQQLFSKMQPSQFIEGAWDLYNNRELDLSAIALEDPGDILIYSCTCLAVTDLDGDRLPELLLRWQEADAGLHLISAENGQLHITKYICVDNQTGSDQIFLYTDPEGQRMAVSSGATGTGAGNYYFTEYFGGDLQPHAAGFSAMDEYDGDQDIFVRVYQLDGEKVEQATYEEAQSSFFEPLTKEKEITFSTFGEDPLNTVSNMLADFFNQTAE